MSYYFPRPFKKNEIEIDPEADGFAGLPSYILAQIFSYIRPRYRWEASKSCHNWYPALLYPGTWEVFQFEDYRFTRRRFTLHSGYQYVIDFNRLRYVVNNTARLWRVLIIKPVTMYGNLYEFLRSLTNYGQFYSNQGDNPFVKLREIEFTWHLRLREVSEKGDLSAMDYGTGGLMLQGVTNFLMHLPGLKRLVIRQLQLEPGEAENFVNNLLGQFGSNLVHLSMLNITKEPYPFAQFGLFTQLKKLVLSTQHLNEELIDLLAEHRWLLEFVIWQDEKTVGDLEPVSTKSWQRFIAGTPKTRVHLRCSGRCLSDLVLQPGAPVVSIVVSHPGAKLTQSGVMAIIENYSATLEVYVQRGFSRRYRSKKFDERADTSFVMLVRNCRALKILGIRERISTATVLLLAHLTSYKVGDFQLVIRQNAVIKRSDWPINQEEWSVEFYRWLCTNSRDYEKTNTEVQKLFGQAWLPKNDNGYIRAFDKS